MWRRIRDLREDKDLPQKEMAQMLHVSQKTYSDYERGKISIPLNILKELALFHDTSIDYLVEITDEPTPHPRGRKK